MPDGQWRLLSWQLTLIFLVVALSCFAFPFGSRPTQLFLLLSMASNVVTVVCASFLVNNYRGPAGESFDLAFFKILFLTVLSLQVTVYGLCRGYSYVMNPMNYISSDSG